MIFVCNVSAPEINLSLTPLNSTSIGIQWKIKTNGKLKSLHMSHGCRKSYCESNGQIADNIIDYSYTLNNLHKGTKYDFNLTVETNAGIFSNANTTSTMEDSKHTLSVCVAVC